MTRTLRLDMDADPALLGTARLFAASSARLAGCSDDVVEDVRLAVSEVCTRAIAGSTEGGRVWVEMRLVPTGLEVEIRGAAVEPLEPTVREAIDIDLVPALFPDTEERVVDGALTVRFLALAT